MNRCKPRIINLFWYFPLYVCQGILPFGCNSHNPCIILNTQTYSHLCISWFFVRSFLLTVKNYQTLKRLRSSYSKELPQIMGSLSRSYPESIPHSLNRESVRRHLQIQPVNSDSQYPLSLFLFLLLRRSLSL